MQLHVHLPVLQKHAKISNSTELSPNIKTLALKLLKSSEQLHALLDYVPQATLKEVELIICENDGLPQLAAIAPRLVTFPKLQRLMVMTEYDHDYQEPEQFDIGVLDQSLPSLIPSFSSLLSVELRDVRRLGCRRPWLSGSGFSRGNFITR